MKRKFGVKEEEMECFFVCFVLKNKAEECKLAFIRHTARPSYLGRILSGKLHQNW